MKVWSSNGSSFSSWCPIREESRLFASCPISESVLSLQRMNFLDINPVAELVHNFQLSSPACSIDWSTHASQNLGYIAAGQKDGTITLVSPGKLEKLSVLSYHKNPVNILAFNPNQTSALLSVSEDNELSVWDLSNPTNSKRISVGGNQKFATGDITGAAWHRKAAYFSIFSLCDNTGLSTVWDIRNGRSTHSFADSQFKFPLSSITFSPSNPFYIATACNDQRNSVVCLWDLRNISSPMKKLHGHGSGVSKIEWIDADDRVLLSAGRDGKIIAWNVETGDQLGSIIDSSSPIIDMKFSPFIQGAVLSSSQTSTQMFSFTDPSIGSKTPLVQPKFHYCPSGVDITFDGRIFQYNEQKVKSFIHQENIAEVSDFLNFVEALESKNLNSFVQKKANDSQTETEKKAWSVISLSMNPESFKENILHELGLSKKDFSALVDQPSQQNVNDFDTNGDSLFASAQNLEESVSVFGTPSNQPDDVFGDVFSPFRVLPKSKDDEFGRVITQALISGDLVSAIDCAFKCERYADAILIASCGPKELFESTRARYIKQMSSPLTRIVSNIIENRLDNLVRYAKTKDWKEIFSVLCNFADKDFAGLSAILGRRLIAERNDYSSALICFVAARDFEMVQQCLFQIYENELNYDSSSAPIVLVVMEKLCAMAGSKAGDVVAPLARSFLQHIIQSGHKQDAIRFVNALPPNPQLIELKNALIGESPKPSPKTNTQPSKNVVSPPQNNNAPSNNTVSPPSVSTYIPNNSTVGRPDSIGAPKPETSIFKPNFVAPQPSEMSNKPPKGDPRQRGPSRGYQPPPPPKVGEQTSGPMLVNVEKLSHNVTSPSSNPGSNTPSFVNPNTLPPVPNPISGTFTPSFANPTMMPSSPNPVLSPPPPTAPVIIAPPSIPKVTPPVISEMPRPSMNTSYLEPPPTAIPTIIAPPPVSSTLPPKPITPFNVPGNNTPQFVSTVPAPEPVPVQKSQEGTIEEVPQQYQLLMSKLSQLMSAIEARQDLNPAAKKALIDAKQKLPHVYAAFRDESVPEELIRQLELFVEKIQSGDIGGASEIKKLVYVKYLNKSRPTALLMNYILNSIK